VPYQLADSVQVRRESWGLLFYRQAHHKLCFVRSGDWLSPAHFDGSWTLESITGDIAGRTGAPLEIVERALEALARRLIEDRVIVDEVR
jgi:putative mycofactocin binding protein MftB